MAKPHTFRSSSGSNNNNNSPSGNKLIESGAAAAAAGQLAEKPRKCVAFNATDALNSLAARHRLFQASQLLAFIHVGKE